MKCKDCKWWEFVGDENNDSDKRRNICRRHSPRPSVIDISDDDGFTAWSNDCDWVPGFVLWPVTDCNDWCGEFENKESKPGPGSHA